MTFNIRYGTAADGANHWSARKEHLFDIVRREDADLIGLQEALDFQIDEIVKAAPIYAVVGVGRDDGREAGEYSAILFNKDRLHVAESGTFWFSDTPAVVGVEIVGQQHHADLHLGAVHRQGRPRVLALQRSPGSSVAAVARTEHGAAARAHQRALGQDRTGGGDRRLQRRRNQPGDPHDDALPARAPRRLSIRFASCTATSAKPARSTASSSAPPPATRSTTCSPSPAPKCCAPKSCATAATTAIRPITFRWSPGSRLASSP